MNVSLSTKTLRHIPLKSWILSSSVLFFPFSHTKLLTSVAYQPITFIVIAPYIITVASLASSSSAKS